MSRPDELPSWCDDDAAVKVVEPSVVKKLAGFLYEERPAFQYVNWLFRNIVKWFTHYETALNQFDAREASTPDMTVVCNTGRLQLVDSVLEIAEYTTPVFVAPSSNPRIDRIVLDEVFGNYSIIEGDEAASPVAPTVQRNKISVAQVLLQTTTTTITNSMITNERASINGSMSSNIQHMLSNMSVRNWTERVLTANTWYGIVWCPEIRLFIVGALSGTGNRIATSPDGINWTLRTSAADYNWANLAWSPELGLACTLTRNASNGPYGMTSPDGINWTLRTLAGSGQEWYGIKWSKELGLFAAVHRNSSAGGQSAMTSPDGINWTRRTLADRGWYDLIWCKEKGLFIAISAPNLETAHSSDGINWTVHSIGVSAINPNCLAWSPELEIFVALGTGAADRAAYSSDGITWTKVSAGDDTVNFTSVTWSSALGVFIATGYGGTGHNIVTSKDGINWFAVQTPTSGINYQEAVWSDELSMFCAVAATGTNKVLTSL